jgi:hypothetical protein
VGTIEQAIPKVRTGSYFPSLLEPRRRAERARQAVVQEADMHGVSTRKVDDLLKALRLDRMSKSEVSRICVELDGEVEAVRSQPITGEHSYVWIDATYRKARQDGRVQAMATVVAIGMTMEGERQLLRVDAGQSEDGRFWTRSCGACTAWIEAPDVGSARRAPEGSLHGGLGGELAALPGALHAEPAGYDPALCAGARGGDRADDTPRRGGTCSRNDGNLAQGLHLQL